MERKQYQGMSYLSGGEGEAVVCLHGIPGSSLTWLETGKALAKEYRVIIPDLIGFGQSAAPKPVLYMEAQAERLARLLQSLGISEVLLCTHDFGGPVALTFMRLVPEVRVKALVVSNTNLFTDTPVPLPLKTAAIPLLGSAFYRLAFGTRAGLFLLYLAAVRRKDRLPWRQFRLHLTGQGMRSTSEIFYISLGDLPGNYKVVEQTLRTMEIPLLVLWAGRDPLFDRSGGERIAGIVPQARLRIYEQCGHFVPEEVDASADIMEFFGSL